MNLSSVYVIGKVNAFTSISINYHYGLIKAEKIELNDMRIGVTYLTCLKNGRQKYTQNHSVYLTQRISKNISDFSIANIDLYSSRFIKLNRIDKLNDLKEGSQNSKSGIMALKIILSKLSLLNYKSYML